MMSLSAYTVSDALKILGVNSTTTVYALCSEGRLPTFKEGGRRLFRREYLDGLGERLTLAASMAPDAKRYDPGIIELYYYWSLLRERNVPPRERQAVIRDCEELIAKGLAVKLDTLVEALSSDYPARRVHDWAIRRQIAAFPIGRSQYYLSARHYRSLVTILLEYETLTGAAKWLGLSFATLRGQIDRGAIKAVDGPDCRRISPQEIEAVAARRNPRRDGLLTPKEAAGILNVSEQLLLTNIYRGRVVSVGANPRLLAASEVERWRQKFTTLPTAFAWLQPRLASPVSTYNVTQTARMLGVASTTITTWAQLGLVPYYAPGAFDDTVIRRYAFVALYIFGLKRFCAGQKPDRGLLRQYMYKCEEKQIIV